jgi:hypothetical protein
MAEIPKVPVVKSNLTLRQIINSSYTGPYTNRFDNAVRDVKRRARIDTVKHWKVRMVNELPERYMVTTYRISVVSINPEGKVSKYPVIILLDYLSVDAPVKLRSGGFGKYTDRGTMDVKRIMPDFYFTFMWVYKKYGILFGRDTTNGKPPVKSNPKQAIGMDKALWGTVIDLVASGFLGKGDEVETKKNLNFVRKLGYPV